jgi:ribosomal protein S1
VSDPHQAFSEGQSVRAAVASIDPVKHRFSVSLKQSLTGTSDADYLRSLFADLEAAERIR